MQRVRIALLGCAALWSGCGDDPKGSNHLSGNNLPDGGEWTQDAGYQDDGGSLQDGEVQPDAGPPEPGSCTPRGAQNWDTLMARSTLLTNAIDGSYAFLGVAADHVYLIDIIGNNSKTVVVRVPVAGGAAETVLSLAEENVRMLLSDTHLYYAAPIDQTAGYPVRYRIPLSAPQSAPEAIGAQSPSYPLLVEGDTLYGYNKTDGTFWRQTFTNGGPTALGTRKSEEPTTLALADNFLYYPNEAFGGESLRRLNPTTGMVEMLAQGGDRTAAPLLIENDTAYWGGAGPLYATTLSPQPQTKTLGQTSGINFSSNLAREPEQLAVHGGRLYWVDEEKSVSWASLDATDCGGILSTSLPDQFIQEYLLEGEWLYVLYEPHFEPGQLWRYLLP